MRGNQACDILLTMKETSWEVSANEYHQLVGREGSYYHQHVIFPRLLKVMALTRFSSVLELGCGQGVFSRVMPEGLTYFGLDASSSLIDYAKLLKPEGGSHYYKVQDVCQKFLLNKTNFTHGVILLALQNMASLEGVMINMAAHLKPGGQAFIVVNHPILRVPQYSSWHVEGPIQYRKLKAYMSRLKIPIDMAPGSPHKAQQTWSFHVPLSDYSRVFKQTGFYIEQIDEWISDKTSVGKNAARENTSRKEFPLFMAFTLKKV